MPNATKPEDATTDLGDQIATLRADLMKLTEIITGDMSDGLEKAGRKITKTGRDAQESATNAVLTHPLAAVGLAAGVGLLLGLVLRKG